ncbi:MAG: hypothetical protein H3C27_00520 [Opitutaceae bacterium]|nr:hypothetical protein [Opitutaceae bacterium]
MSAIRKNSLRTPDPSAARANRPARMKDIIWGRPIFKAPALNPRHVFDPLPFTATRVTHPVREETEV